MRRRRRTAPGGFVYHVYNRGSRKGGLFRRPDDYLTFIHLAGPSLEFINAAESDSLETLSLA